MKTHIRSLGAIFVGLIILGGCTTTGNVGSSFETSNVGKIRPGVTTKQDVERYLGAPMNRSALPGGQETWVYYYGEGSSRASWVSYIPGIGPSLDHNVEKRMEGENVEVVFRGNVVSDCTHRLEIREGRTHTDSEAGLRETTIIRKCHELAQISNGVNAATRTTGASTAPARSGNASALDANYEVQTLLNQLGYATGRPDGIVGPRTQAAIRQFQGDQGLAVNGEVTPELVERLRKVVQAR
jgi:outer membrane protein assembly factor BamE (lipoprotein component of BamABCDE complex)